jgi:hypothetical protein
LTDQVVSTSAKLQLPIEVIGSDLEGRQFIERTQTLTIHRGGATLLLTNKLAPGSEVIVHNLGNGEESLAYVVGQIRKEHDSHVYALSFLDPSVDLWHFQFPPAAPATEILLECNYCHTMSPHFLSEIEMEVFTARGDLTFPCEVCRSYTIWKRAKGKAIQKSQKIAQQPAQITQTAPPGEDRRMHRRTPMRAPACVRISGKEEIVTCEDISRGGFRFISQNEYPEGTLAEAAVPFTQSSTNIFSPICVVFCAKMPDGRYRQGVAYVKKSGPFAHNL